ncbi:ANTAR domain-containing response regulator [Rhodococcus chondri]|uniref:GAF and ANTAR domain-containing protein n=1 Tax=Rhodococcus chondri TaxID=3065941 RepID=A0ABU7JTQ0_9NOCA|nr:GAF and ANTAR domain-containing protein [Rhodococcus sp. CC-R104]MEE2033401.1 GAF and ANTAR domain-containing protein [Rhodococcus sp. CC-R104]
MSKDRELVATLSQFTRQLLSTFEVHAALASLVSNVTQALDLIGCGVSLQADGRLKFITAAVDTVTVMERCQERYQQGPCEAAYAQGVIVAVTDVRTLTTEWPEFAAEAKRVGVAGAAGIPIRLGDVKIGALNLYAAHPRVWTADELAIAQLLADVAAAHIVSADRVRQLEDLTGQLRSALSSRVIIEQAKGIIAEARGINPDKAFDRIRAHARSHQVSVREVARAIIEVGLRV